MRVPAGALTGLIGVLLGASAISDVVVSGRWLQMSPQGHQRDSKMSMARRRRVNGVEGTGGQRSYPIAAPSEEELRLDFRGAFSAVTYSEDPWCGHWRLPVGEEHDGADVLR